MRKKFRPANDIDPRSFKLFPFYDLIMNRHNFALTQVSSNSLKSKNCFQSYFCVCDRCTLSRSFSNEQYEIVSCNFHDFQLRQI